MPRNEKQQQLNLARTARQISGCVSISVSSFRFQFPFHFHFLLLHMPKFLVWSVYLLVLIIVAAVASYKELRRSINSVWGFARQILISLDAVTTSTPKHLLKVSTVSRSMLSSSRMYTIWFEYWKVSCRSLAAESLNITIASFPGPCPASRRLQYCKVYHTASDGKLGGGLGTRLI